MNLCCIFCGWRKASKCKKLIEELRERIEESKKRRDSIITHLSAAILQLLKNSQDQNAWNEVSAYELLDHLCECIMSKLPDIRRSRDCPIDINEAASSLIYASARCGDLPELPKLRKLFGERYGKGFETAAVELLPGNLVNRCLIQKLSVVSVSEVDELFGLMKEEATENYCPEMETDIIDCGENIIGDSNSAGLCELSPEELRFEEMECNFQSQKTNASSRELYTRETSPDDSEAKFVATIRELGSRCSCDLCTAIF
ncbi:hypothetical protein MKW94_005222 [Papaver nudicaule]|uniref:IST1-like protein n=1 Tax=Papaver nudicaule TaxID=74823 RepID=A0AA41SIZ5_PAPNU|nr:hypothetical protein [Papaver nudicaule]